MLIITKGQLDFTCRLLEASKTDPGELARYRKGGQFIIYLYVCINIGLLVSWILILTSKIIFSFMEATGGWSKRIAQARYRL